MEWYINLLLIFIFSLGSSLLIISNVMRISFRKRLFDLPDSRKVHSGIIPRLGGVAFFPAIVFSFTLLAGWNVIYNGSIAYLLLASSSEVSFGLCALVLLYLTGIQDDLVGVSYKNKFLIQFSCGVLLVASGIWINNLYGILGIYELSSWIGKPLTIFLAVFIINAINLIDGLDGLASGLSGIALLLSGIIFITTHQWLYSMLAFATLGSLIPFFYSNVFGYSNGKHKIFMGDTGSLTIGMILSFLIIRLSMYEKGMETPLTGNILIAFSLIIVPMLDVMRVVNRRLRNGTHPFKPDKNHIHHKFLALGLSHRASMLLILLLAMVFIIMNFLLLSVLNINLIVIIDLIFWISLHYWISYRIKYHPST